MFNTRSFASRITYTGRVSRPFNRLGRRMRALGASFDFDLGGRKSPVFVPVRPPLAR
jgi:hypothetical protein